MVLYTHSEYQQQTEYQCREETISIHECIRLNWDLLRLESDCSYTIYYYDSMNERNEIALALFAVATTHTQSTDLHFYLPHTNIYIA